MRKTLLAIMMTASILGTMAAEEPDPNFYIYICFG